MIIRCLLLEKGIILKDLIRLLGIIKHQVVLILILHGQNLREVDILEELLLLQEQVLRCVKIHQPNLIRLLQVVEQILLEVPLAQQDLILLHQELAHILDRVERQEVQVQHQEVQVLLREVQVLREVQQGEDNS